MQVRREAKDSEVRREANSSMCSHTMYSPTGLENPELNTLWDVS